MPRTPIIVNLDDQDHIIIGDERTACGLVVPQGTAWVDSPEMPCPVCFPDEKPKGKKKS